ncbi:MAG: SDR family NAD(P)-dependent oxidoreductase, partial [Candidatus Norongarragalinales archaeon]
MALKRKTALVTGGAGFVGSHLVEALVDRGVSVRVLDNFDRGRLAYLDAAKEKGSVEVVKGDVRNRETVRKAVHGADYVFHEAAVCINKSVKFPEEAIDTNIWGTVNTVLAAKNENVEKFVFASSASIYGNPRQIPMTEEHGFFPETPYCVSKIAGEQLLSIYSKELNYVTLRYFNVYGPRQSTDAFYTSVILSFIKKFDAGERPIIHGDGTQTMDFVHVRDVVQANLLAVEKSVSREVFNVASGVETSVNDLVRILNDIYGKNLEPI